MPFSKAHPSPVAFKKGQSGNPKGAPKRNWTWAGELEKAVQRKYKDGTPVKQAVADSLVTQAVGGNVVATKELMNRMDGMPPQPVEQQGTIKFEVIIRE